MAGCVKAGRNKKSAANAAYKAGNREDVNRKRKVKRHQVAAAKHKAKKIKVPRGTARARRRGLSKGMQQQAA